MTEQEMRDTLFTWIKAELAHQTPVFTDENLIEAGVEASDADVLRRLTKDMEESGYYKFAMNWAFSSDEAFLASDDAVSHELISGFIDVVRDVHRARTLLRAERMVSS